MSARPDRTTSADTVSTASMVSFRLGYDHKYVYSHFGYNLKATDLQAAIGCAQLEKFPTFVERRRHNFDRLKAGLAGTEDNTDPAGTVLRIPDPSWFGFLITCKEGVDRNKVVQYVENKGVQTRMLFAGNLIKHPCFDEMRAKEKRLPRSRRLWTNTDRIMQRYLLGRRLSGHDR